MRRGSFAGSVVVWTILSTSFLVLTSSAVTFNRYQVPHGIAPHGNRDLELWWSQTYTDSGFSLVAGTGLNQLDRLAKSLCEDHANPFGYPMSDLQLVYDYLAFPDPNHAAPYDTSAAEPIGFLVSQNPQSIGSPDDDHIDLYLYAPNTKTTFYYYWKDPAHPNAGDLTANYGETWSHFHSAAEDT